MTPSTISFFIVEGSVFIIYVYACVRIERKHRRRFEERMQQARVSKAMTQGYRGSIP